MSAHSPLPHLSVAGGENRQDRTGRLHHAYDAMCAVVRILWPTEETLPSDPNAVRWQGAVLSVQEVEDDLVVVWKDARAVDQHGRRLEWFRLLEV
jgi:hypothetical protein